MTATEVGVGLRSSRRTPPAPLNLRELEARWESTYLEQRERQVTRAHRQLGLTWADAEQAVDNAFYRCGLRLPAMFAHGKPDAYLTTAVNNAAADEHRRLKRTQPLPPDNEAFHRGVGADASNDSVSAANVRNIRDLLTEAQLEVIDARADGISDADIALELNVSDAAVRQRRKDARKRLNKDRGKWL